MCQPGEAGDNGQELDKCPEVSHIVWDERDEFWFCLACSLAPRAQGVSEPGTAAWS